MTTSAPEPENPDGPSTVRERAIAEAVSVFIDRQSRWEAIDVETFCRQNPDLMPELRMELETVANIDSILGMEIGPPQTKGAEGPLPDHLSGHKILGEIGSGGMGRVLLAMDEGLNRRVAIKMLSA